MAIERCFALPIPIAEFRHKRQAARGEGATKRKRRQRGDAEDAEGRRAFSLTTDTMDTDKMDEWIDGFPQGFEAAGMVVFLFFIPAVWQGQTNHSSIFQNPV